MKTLTVRGSTVTVDDSTHAKYAQMKWRLNRDGYAVTGTNNKPMHRMVIEAQPGQIVDHINRNKLDNRLENLRVVDRSMNSLNRNAPKTNTSGHAGVTHYRDGVRWVANIMKEKKRIHLGLFDTLEEAVAARETAYSQMAR